MVPVCVSLRYECIVRQETHQYWSEIADFKPISARSASAVTPGEKVQLTLIGSPLRAFQRA